MPLIQCALCLNKIYVDYPVPEKVVCSDCLPTLGGISPLERNELNWLREVVKVAKIKLSNTFWQSILDTAAESWAPHMFGVPPEDPIDGAKVEDLKR